LAQSETACDICEALGLSRATLHRTLTARIAQLAVAGLCESPAGDSGAVQPDTEIEAPVRTSPRALSAPEREVVLDTLHSERFVDVAPPQVHAALLDEGSYLCSVSTMYRLLSERGEVKERRNQLTHPVYTRHELLATRPNELWSWDITKLLGVTKWTYYYLYVILDVFSRCVVGWTLQYRESSHVAEQLMAQSCEKQRIMPGELTMHADNGSSMTSKPVAFLLADLGVTKTHSRPHVSNDNPYSESQFKTMKYRPDFPQRFESIEEARAFCQVFFEWYNAEHRHSGIAMLTPNTVHYGRAQEAIAARSAILTAAFIAHPERFVRKRPVPQSLPGAVWINPPLPAEPSRDGS
jgi:putative transposase